MKRVVGVMIVHRWDIAREVTHGSSIWQWNGKHTETILGMKVHQMTMDQKIRH